MNCLDAYKELVGAAAGAPDKEKREHDTFTQRKAFEYFVCLHLMRPSWWLKWHSAANEGRVSGILG